MILGVIPARGGSKGIPYKNIKRLNGKPLISYVIDAALESKIDKLVVSTDDELIAMIAKDCGAEVKMRGEGISGDKDASELALLDVIYDSPNTDILCFLQCTSPLTTADDINGCIDGLEDHDCCFSVQETTALLWDEEGAINHEQSYRDMRQDRIQYEETGAIYAMKAKGFLEHEYRFFGKLSYHITPHGVDIDTEDDFKIAEVLLNDRNTG